MSEWGFVQWGYVRVGFCPGFVVSPLLAVSTVSQCPVAWSPDCIKGIPWLIDGLTDEWHFVDILVA